MQSNEKAQHKLGFSVNKRAFWRWFNRDYWGLFPIMTDDCG